MAYLGCLGYNDSAEALGEPSGFWRFEDYVQLWSAFERSEALNAAFEQLGAPTYSRILWDVDADGRSEFHLLVISAQPIFPRESALLDKARAWLREGIQNE